MGQCNEDGEMIEVVKVETYPIYIVYQAVFMLLYGGVFGITLYDLLVFFRERRRRNKPCRLNVWYSVVLCLCLGAMTRVFSFVDADEVTQELFRFAKDNLWLMSILQIILYWLEMQSMRRVSHLQRLRPYFIVTMSVYAVIEALKTVAEVWVKEGPMELIMTLLALLVYAAVVVTAAVNGIKLLLKLREIKRKGGQMDKALRQLTLAMSAEVAIILLFVVFYGFRAFIFKKAKYCNVWLYWSLKVGEKLVEFAMMTVLCALTRTKTSQVGKQSQATASTSSSPPAAVSNASLVKATGRGRSTRAAKAVPEKKAAKTTASGRSIKSARAKPAAQSSLDNLLMELEMTQTDSKFSSENQHAGRVKRSGSFLSSDKKQVWVQVNKGDQQYYFQAGTMHTQWLRPKETANVELWSCEKFQSEVSVSHSPYPLQPLSGSVQAPHIAIPGPPAKAPANEDSETKLLISPEDDLGDIPEEAEHDDTEEEGVEESEHDQLVLPDGWIEDIEDGQVYYLYAATGDWQWTHPALGVEVEIEE